MKLSRGLIVFLAVVLVVGLAVSYVWFVASQREQSLKIFHAGSLALALKDVEEAYERSHPYIDIMREPSGSVKAVRKVSDLGKRCDVVMVADYTVIEKYLFPEYANWLIIFCSNEVVLCYTDKSAHSDMINEDNWYEVLTREGVRYGFSNPNIDPCGYRSLSILYIASQYYGEAGIWESLVTRYIRNIRVEVNSSGHYLFFPAEPEYEHGEKLVLRDKSVDLIQLLEAGTLDYAFEYRSVAEEHGLKYVRLPPELNLAGDPFIDVYVVLYSGDPQRQRAIEITKIRYGLTIPNTCENCEEAVKFLEWLLYGEGIKILEEHGFTLIPYEYVGNVPAPLRRS